MEEYNNTDKTWWWATDFMYKHLLSTGQSWSHVQKLKFVENLSERFERIQRNARLPQSEQEPQFDIENVSNLIESLELHAYLAGCYKDNPSNKEMFQRKVDEDKLALRCELGIDDA